MTIAGSQNAKSIRGLAAFLLLGSFAAVHAQSGDGLEVLRVQPDFYMIARAGGNIGVQMGSDGVLLVDTWSPAASDQVLAAIGQPRGKDEPRVLAPTVLEQCAREAGKVVNLDCPFRFFLTPI